MSVSEGECSRTVSVHVKLSAVDLSVHANVSAVELCQFM